MRKTAITIFVAMNFILLCQFSIAVAADPVTVQAVESIGELNAKDNSAGTVIAGTTTDLILSIVVDMSQAEPGEEVASIQMTMPTGFSAKSNAVNSVIVRAKAYRILSR